MFDTTMFNSNLFDKHIDNDLFSNNSFSNDTTVNSTSWHFEPQQKYQFKDQDKYHFDKNYTYGNNDMPFTFIKNDEPYQQQFQLSDINDLTKSTVFTLDGQQLSFDTKEEIPLFSFAVDADSKSKPNYFKNSDLTNQEFNFMHEYFKSNFSDCYSLKDLEDDINYDFSLVYKKEAEKDD